MAKGKGIKTVRLSNLRTRIDKGLKEIGKESLPERSKGLKVIADVIEKLFPEEKINRNSLSLATIDKEIAEKVYKSFVPNAKNIPEDFEEHIFLYAPNTGKIYVPKKPIPIEGLDPKKRWPMVEVFFNPHYHTVDLGSKTYKREFGDGFTMRDCADYILSIDKHAKELTLDQYAKVRELRGRLPMSLQGEKKMNPKKIEEIIKRDETGLKQEGKVFIPES